MEIIRKRITFYHNNEITYENICSFQIVEEIPNSENIKITWENIKDVYSNYGALLPFALYETKKGKIISLFYCSLFKKSTWDIKEYKTDNLNMSIQIDYLPATDVSIKTILEYRDTEKAIKYLIEKGLSITYDKKIKIS